MQASSIQTEGARALNTETLQNIKVYILYYIIEIKATLTQYMTFLTSHQLQKM